MYFSSRLRQTKEHKEAYGEIPSYVKGGIVKGNALAIADITVSEDNQVIITPVSEINSTDETN